MKAEDLDMSILEFKISALQKIYREELHNINKGYNNNCSILRDKYVEEFNRSNAFAYRTAIREKYDEDYIKLWNEYNDNIFDINLSFSKRIKIVGEKV